MAEKRNILVPRRPVLNLVNEGHERKKEKMASGGTMTGTMSGMNCIVTSMTGEEAGVRAGVRAEA